MQSIHHLCRLNCTCHFGTKLLRPENQARGHKRSDVLQFPDLLHLLGAARGRLITLATLVQAIAVVISLPMLTQILPPKLNSTLGATCAN